MDTTTKPRTITSEMWREIHAATQACQLDASETLRATLIEVGYSRHFTEQDLIDAGIIFARRNPKPATLKGGH